VKLTLPNFEDMWYDTALPHKVKDTIMGTSKNQFVYFDWCRNVPNLYVASLS